MGAPISRTSSLSPRVMGRPGGSSAAVDPHPAEQGAVGRPDVGELPAAGRPVDAGVAGGDEGVVEDEPVAGHRAHREPLVGEGDDALAPPVADPQPRLGRHGSLDRTDAGEPARRGGLGVAGGGLAEEGAPAAEGEVDAVGQHHLGHVLGADPGAPARPVDERVAGGATLDGGLEPGEARVRQRDVAVRGSADRGLVAQGDAQQLLTMTEESELGHDCPGAYARNGPHRPSQRRLAVSRLGVAMAVASDAEMASNWTPRRRACSGRGIARAGPGHDAQSAQGRLTVVVEARPRRSWPGGGTSPRVPSRPRHCHAPGRVPRPVAVAHRRRNSWRTSKSSSRPPNWRLSPPAAPLRPAGSALRKHELPAGPPAHLLMKSPTCRSLCATWVFSHRSRNPSSTPIISAESPSDSHWGTRDLNLRLT